MPDEESDLKMGGLTVQQFAGVAAAVAEGIELEAVLEQERISEDQWVSAQRMWRVAIAESPDLQLRYVDARALAEDTLTRSIEPLDADASSWMGFLGAIATRGTKEVLARYGLSMSDLARLGRAWKRRQLTESSLSAELERLAPLAPAPSRVEIGPARLQRFPWSPSDIAVPNESDALEPSVGLRIEPTPLPELQRATFQLRDDREAGSQVDPDETLPIPTSLATGAALPFAGMTSLERLAWLSSARGPSTIPEDANPDETLPIPRCAPSPATGTFRDRLGAVEVPVLSLDEYAQLRARLLVWGEDHAPTLARFGVSVRPVHAALKARFAEYFERVPEARAAFVDALAARVAELRAGR